MQVLEDEEEAEVGDQAGGEEDATAARALFAAEPKTDAEVDGRREQEKEEIFRLPPTIKEIARGEGDLANDLLFVTQPDRTERLVGRFPFGRHRRPDVPFRGERIQGPA